MNYHITNHGEIKEQEETFGQAFVATLLLLGAIVVVWKLVEVIK